MNIIGIDSGSSMIKLVEVDEKGNLLNKLIINKVPIMEAIEKFLKEEQIAKTNISKIVLTGVGSDEVQGDIYNIPTIKVDEFVAIGTGGLYLTEQSKALIVSIGTGTAFVMAEGNLFKHIGGTGVGGGTLLNLCKRIGNLNSFEEINEAILKGNIRNIDLTIEDVTTQEIPNLPKDTTSANFGKLKSNATKEDIIIGIANMIFETIGVMAVFATQNTESKNIIVVGNVATMPYMRKVLEKIEKLHNVKFIIPEEAEFATIIGAIKSIN